jgi:hypothetical protein
VGDLDLPGFMRCFTDEASYANARADFMEQVRPSCRRLNHPRGRAAHVLFSRSVVRH